MCVLDAWPGGLWPCRGRDVPITAACVGAHGEGALQDTKGQRALTPACGQASAPSPAAPTRLGTWVVAFPKGISHPGVKHVPGKRGRVTHLCGAGGGRWMSPLQTHLGCHSGKHCSCLAEQLVYGGRHLTWLGKEAQCKHEGSRLSCFSSSGSVCRPLLAEAP